MMNPYQTDRLQLLCGGMDLFPAMIEAVDAAQHEVRLETYIFEFTGAAEHVAQTLERAALRGVKVFVVVDGVGTPYIPNDWSKRFEAAGVQLRVFSPVNILGVFMPSRWRRLHRKLCVIDKEVAFCGGINMMDDYLDPHVQGRLSHPRLDYAVCVHGALVLQVHETMTQLWSRIEALRELRSQEFGAALEVLHSVERAKSADTPNKSVKLILRDNVRHRSHIERTYRKAIGAAKREVVVASAYFFPALRLRRALILAAQRGVRVRLLLQGRYEYWVPYRATQKLYDQLLAAGIEIYEYQASFLHAKVAVVDDAWATVGSSNLDPLSLLLAREANVVTNQAEFVQTLRQDLEKAIAQGATRVDPQTYLNRSWMQRTADALASAVLRFGVFLTGMRY